MKTVFWIDRFTAGALALGCAVAALMSPAAALAQSKESGGAAVKRAEPEAVRYLESSDATGTSSAVVVGRVPLAHTAQVLPVDVEGRVIGASSGALQVEKTLDNLAAALAEVQSGLDQLVKVNVYVARLGMVREVERVFSRRFTGKAKPAISFVETKLRNPEALVAMDGVAMARAGTGETTVLRRTSAKLMGTQSTSHVALLPEGAKVYVSGQAEPGEIKLATRKTMDSLLKTLNQLDLDRRRIVQLKAFLQPIAAIPEVEREIAQSFTDQAVPPLVFVEWTSTSQSPIEIELIAAGGDQSVRARETVEYMTPPGMKTSPVYSRVARINFGQTIYFSGLYGSSSQSGEPQVKEIFAALGFLLEQAGSDLRHLVKATYYVSDEDASRKLNELRPTYYDPKRPPAASKAMVAGVASEGKTVTLDMIAVTKQ